MKVFLYFSVLIDLNQVLFYIVIERQLFMSLTLKELSKYNYPNDRKLYALLLVKSKKDGLTFGENRRLNKLSRLYKESMHSHNYSILNELHGYGYIKDLNETDYDPETGMPAKRLINEPDYIITRKGVEALTNETFPSESEERLWSSFDKRATRFMAWVGGVGAFLLTVDKFLPFIEKSINSVKSLLGWM